MRWLLVGIALASITTATVADQWPPPRPQTFASHDGQYRLTVFPRELAGALPYFQDKVDNESPAGQRPGRRATCQATLERLTDDRYEQLWRKPLVNDVSPVTALVSDADGSFVTFDNWHSAGWGDDAIVIYTGAGDLVRKFALVDIMTEKQFQELPRSVSSIWWNGEHRLDDEERVVRIQVVTNGEMDEEKREYRTIQVSLTDGSIIK